LKHLVTQTLNLKCDLLVPKCAFNCNLYRFAKSAVAFGGAIMSPSDAADAEAAAAAAAAYAPPTKETIAERKRALLEATKAALARAGRKPLLSAANKAAVTAGAIANENPWMQ
jgi:hypothetical protein